MASNMIFIVFSLALMISNVLSHPSKLRGHLDGYHESWHLDEHRPHYYGSSYPPVAPVPSSTTHATETGASAYSTSILPTSVSFLLPTGTGTGTGGTYPTGYIDRAESYSLANKKRHLFQGPRRHDFVHYYPYVASYGSNTPTGGSSTGGPSYPTSSGTVYPTGSPTGTGGTHQPTGTAPTGTHSTTTAPTSSSAPYPSYY